MTTRFIAVSADTKADPSFILATSDNRVDAYPKAVQASPKTNAIMIHETTPRLGALIDLGSCRNNSWHVRQDDGKADLGHFHYAVFGRRGPDGEFVDYHGLGKEIDAPMATLDLCERLGRRFEATYVVVSFPFELEFHNVFEGGKDGVFRLQEGREALAAVELVHLHADEFDQEAQS